MPGTPGQPAGDGPDDEGHETDRTGGRGGDGGEGHAEEIRSEPRPFDPDAETRGGVVAELQPDSELPAQRVSGTRTAIKISSGCNSERAAPLRLPVSHRSTTWASQTLARVIR